MKLRGRIIVAFLTVMMIPLFMISIVSFSIFQMQFQAVEQSFAINEETFSAVTNPILYVNRITRNVYNEVKLCAIKTPERLENMEYVDSLNDRIRGKYSFLAIRKGGKLVYTGEPEITRMLLEELPPYGQYSTDVDGGTYIGGERPLLVKQKDFLYLDGTEGSAFVITDVSDVMEDLKQSVTRVFMSVVISMFITAVLVTWWLYRSMLRPLRALQDSTNRIKEGDLNVSVKSMCDDEIGELCGDFEEMRLHLKSLLDENMRHQRESKELISNISHDLKTPLTAIKGYAEGILDGVADTPEKREKYLRTIYTKANDMSVLVDELSMYAKIDTNSVPYHFQSLNLNHYFEDSIEETKLDLELQGMELAYFPYVSKTQEIIADPEQLKRVITNIISNAVKYREPTRKGIICIRTIEIDDYYVRIEIEDNGKGIAAEDLPSVFERFYRTDTSRNSATGGSGLGLAISRKIIEDHGGTIWAESRIGVGTTIFMLLRKTRIQQAESIETDEVTEKADRKVIDGLVSRWNQARHVNKKNEKPEKSRQEGKNE